MLITELISDGALPVLEQSLRFAGARQRLIAHNAANLDTPDFQPLDVDPAHFQHVLGEAVRERRSRTGGAFGTLRPRSTAQISFSNTTGAAESDGAFTLTPRTPSGNILFHDRNNRDLERLMQSNAENVAAYRVASDLLRSRFDLLKAAIAERA